MNLTDVYDIDNCPNCGRLLAELEDFPDDIDCPMCAEMMDVLEEENEDDEQEY